MPAEPVRRAIENWLAERNEPELDYAKEETVGGYPISPRRQILNTVFGYEEGQYHSHARSLHRLLDRREGGTTRQEKRAWGRVVEVLDPYMQETIDFDLADRLITKLEIGWNATPELEEAYENADLLILDLNRPTSPAVDARLRKKVEEALERVNGNVALLARSMGVTRPWLARYLGYVAPAVVETTMTGICEGPDCTNTFTRRRKGRRRKFCSNRCKLRWFAVNEKAAA